MIGRCLARLTAVGLIFVSLSLLSGCGASFTKVRDFDKGSILVLPTLNAQQGGKYHPYENGKSGPMLDRHVINELNEAGWVAFATESESFSHLEIPTLEARLAEAGRLEADYALYMELGEFLDAAAMTFRSDYVTLNAATLHDSRTGELVWSTKEPGQYGSGTNLGTIWSLFDDIAESVVLSIKANANQ